MSGFSQTPIRYSTWGVAPFHLGRIVVVNTANVPGNDLKSQTIDNFIGVTYDVIHTTTHAKISSYRTQ